MGTASLTDLDVARLRPSRETFLVAGLVFNVNLLLVFAYVALADVALASPRYAVYGLLWVTVGLWVLARVDASPASRTTRQRALVVAIGYFLALAITGGMIRWGSTPDPTAFRIVWLPPGWGPALLYQGPLASVLLMPARVVGYLALSYLVYTTVIDAAGAAVTGVLGLLSCVSCSWPIVASLITAVLGGGSALAATAMSFTYDLSTAVFLVTVALLYWRPLIR